MKSRSWSWPNNCGSNRSKERHSSAIIKICTPCVTSLLFCSFAPLLSHSGHLFTSIISWNLFVCWSLFVLSVDGVMICCFCFCCCIVDFYVCIVYIKVDYFVADSALIIVWCQFQFSIFSFMDFVLSKCKQTLFFSVSSQTERCLSSSTGKLYMGLFGQGNNESNFHIPFFYRCAAIICMCLSP